MPVDAHSSPPSTRTTSERVNTPASAQNDNALSGAATNSIIAKAAVTWPSVTNEASISTSSHGVGGAGMPVPLPNTHGVVADCTSCVKLAPVGSNTSEYNDPPENIERNTGRKAHQRHHHGRTPAIYGACPQMGTFQRTEQHSALLGLECIPTIMELLDLLAVCEQDMQGRCGDLRLSGHQTA